MDVHDLSKTQQPVKWIRIKDISVIWIQSQRPWDSVAERSKNKIIKEFDPDAFGILQVTLPNGKGIYHCVDGQGRHRAVKEMWGGDERVPCQVLNAKTPKRAAELFAKFNTSRSHVSAVYRFNVAVTACEPVELACSKILASLGYVAALDHEPSSIRAIGTVLSVYRQHGPDVLMFALSTIKDTWGFADGAVEGAILRGYGLFFGSYDNIDISRLIKTGKKRSPGHLLDDAKAYRLLFGVPLATATSAMLFESYNRGTKKNARLTDRD